MVLNLPIFYVAEDGAVFCRHSAIASESKESQEASNLQLNLDAAQHKQINKTTCLHIDPSTVKKHNQNITKFHEWFMTEMKKTSFFEGDVRSLFVNINYEVLMTRKSFWSLKHDQVKRFTD